MPATWTSYWGNAFHGLYVTWNNDIINGSDDTLKVTFQANWYAEQIVAGNSGTDEYYDLNTYAAYDLTTGLTDGTYHFTTPDTEEFTMYIAWASTEASCSDICYDAIDAKVFIEICVECATGQAPSYVDDDLATQAAIDATGDWDANAGDYNTWYAYWAPRAQTTCGTDDGSGNYSGESWTSATDGIFFDSIPTVEYAYGSQYYDVIDNVECGVTADTPHEINGTVGAQLGGMCTEIWELTQPTTACVKMEGTLQRLLNTSDTDDDLILGYVPYTMHAQAGMTVDLAEEDFQFGKIEVDFGYFREPDETSAVANFAATSVVMATSLALNLL